MNKYSIHYNKDRFSEGENNQIEAALLFSTQQHGDQQRASGEPYIIHPIAVAETVAEWGMDYEAVMAALLHDVVEDTPVTSQVLEEQFGVKVAQLVEGVTKMRLSVSPRPAADSARLEASNENLRKLLLATAKDVRVILIKLADRLHNLRTLGHLPPEKRAVIARESLQVYAPVADRLGMGKLKGELEDLGFRYAMPEEYAELEKLVRVTTKKAQRYLSVLKRAIGEYLKQGGVTMLEIEARQKHYYSIYKKMLKVDGDIEKIYDLVAVRVIVPDVSACYQALGILHQHYKPLIYRIKDYIAVPKPNGYRSLHTTVFAEDGHISEIQIRTPAMHEAAEYGLAAHFYYDAQKTTGDYTKRRDVATMPDNLGWVRRLQDLQRAANDGREFVEGARLELFVDRIFVFSPKGDLYDLPEGATSLDFAFAIHSDVGLRALGAKVNGRMLPLDTRLENRDVVEIITRREAAPSRDWLGNVVTSHAKNRIRSWFRSTSREVNIASGRLALEEALAAWSYKHVEDIPKRAIQGALDYLHTRSLDDLLMAIGEGTFTASQVIRRLFPDAAKPANTPTVKRAESTGRVEIEGDQLPYVLAPCCNPVFPQPLIGYVTRGKGITVHGLACRNKPTDSDRYVTCRWETKADATEKVVCQVEVRAVNRIGLIHDITSVIAAQKLNIAGMSSRQIEPAGKGVGETAIRFGLEVPDLFVLAAVMRTLEHLSGVAGVQRVL